MPIRIQRKRVKGWRMPANTVSITRPGKWGNPFSVVPDALDDNLFCVIGGGVTVKGILSRERAIDICLEHYKKYLEDSIQLGRLIPNEIKGKDVACFCKVGEKCHGDILLERVN